jgi:uncharacterized protein YecE (DUF72 family)
MLFDDAFVPRVELCAHARTLQTLSEKLPATLAMGTSSWTFPTWDGLVYDKKYSQEALVHEGLRAYASHPLFRTVGLDRTFYRPMQAQEMREIADAVPAGFRFLVKAHGEVTKPHAPGSKTGHGTFLDIAWTRDQVLAPAVEGLRKKLGVVLFQFPTIDLRPARFSGGIDAFLDQLAAFLASLPANVPCAVEVRNRELLSNQHREKYVLALRQAGVEHCYSGHPSMPTIGTQMELVPPRASAGNTGPPITCRWLLHASRAYEEAKDAYYPFQSLADPDEATRAEIARLSAVATAMSRDILVVVNNKAEGSAPLSIEQLALAIVKQLESRT